MLKKVADIRFNYIWYNRKLKHVKGPKHVNMLTCLGRVAWWLATCARKAKVPGSSPAASYVQR